MTTLWAHWLFLFSKMPRETKAKILIPEAKHPRRSKGRGASAAQRLQQLSLLHALSSWSSSELSLISPPSLTPPSLPVPSKAKHLEWLLKSSYNQFLRYLNYSSPWIITSTQGMLFFTVPGRLFPKPECLKQEALYSHRFTTSGISSTLGQFYSCHRSPADASLMQS